MTVPVHRLRAAAGTVRGRATLATLLVVGLAILIGAFALVSSVRELIAEDVAKASRLRVAEVGDEAVQSVSVFGRWPTGIAVIDPDDECVQLVSLAGAVVGASRNVAGLPPLAPPSTKAIEVAGPLTEKPLLVVSETIDTPRGPVRVVVGHSLDSAEDASEKVALLLVVGLPPLLAVIGLAAWLLIGRALAPVEAIRAQVETISSTDLDRRVPESAGQDEIARLARTMNGMLGRLEESARRQQRFTSDASHELRSPLAAIRQHAEVSLAHPDRYPAAELAATVLDDALRMQRLVDDLLLLASADERPAEGVREAVDLDDLVFEEAARLRADTPLRVDTVGVSAGQVRGDPEQLGRMLRNLTDNAARHAEARIALGLGEDDDQVLLTVEDDGPGIPEAERYRVLRRFVRLDPARARDEGGSGLGLAIVAELARTHHAELRITDGELGGARIELRFPRPAG